MSLRVLSAALLGWTIFSAPANAAVFDFSFFGSDGNGTVKGSGSIATSITGPTYNVQSVTGTLSDTDLGLPATSGWRSFQTAPTPMQVPDVHTVYGQSTTGSETLLASRSSQNARCYLFVLFPRVSGSLPSIRPYGLRNPGMDPSPVLRTRRGMAHNWGLPGACLPGEGDALSTVRAIQVPYGWNQETSSCWTMSDSTAGERQASLIAGSECSASGTNCCWRLSPPTTSNRAWPPSVGGRG